MSLPLYDVLFNNTSNKELTLEQKSEAIKEIPLLDNKGHEFLFLLIRCYGLRNNIETDIFKIPFDGISINKNMKFDLNKFPSKLQNMIIEFIEKHKQVMKEEEQER